MMSNSEIDGFYCAYFAGNAGEGFALLVFRSGVLIGTDAGSFLYDGSYQIEANGYAVEATVVMPPRAASISGLTAGPEGLSYSLKFQLPQLFLELPFIRIETPGGPVNLRLVKLRDLSV